MTAKRHMKSLKSQPLLDNLCRDDETSNFLFLCTAIDIAVTFSTVMSLKQIQPVADKLGMVAAYSTCSACRKFSTCIENMARHIQDGYPPDSARS